MLCLCFFILPPFVEVFYATEQALFNIRHAVLWSFRLDHEDKCFRFYYQCSLWAKSFLRKIHVVCTTSSHQHCCTGQCSSNQPALCERDISAVPPLWKSCSDRDHEYLPKVDVRTPQTTLSYCLVCYREIYTQEHYVFACTCRHLSCLDGFFCTVIKAFALFVTYSMSVHNDSS